MTAIIIPRVAARRFNAQSEGRDCRLKGISESGIDISVRYRVAGIRGGLNECASSVLFATRNALKEAGTMIAHPHRMIAMNAAPPG